MKGDELVHILEGSTTLDIVTGDGPPHSLPFVPEWLRRFEGAWHRFRSSDGVTVISKTAV